MIEWFEPLYSTLWASFSGSALWMLFLGGFLSATLLPGGSEVALMATLNLHHNSPYLVVIVATVGNTLGGVVNYGLGIWIPNRTQSQKRSQTVLVWLQKYGYWTLLLSWLPLIGDLMCVAAGWLRMKFALSVIMIFFGKAIRYSVLAAVFLGFF